VTPLLALALLSATCDAGAFTSREATRSAARGNPEALYSLAACYFAMGRPEDGRRAVAELAGRYPNDPAVLLAAGSLLLHNGLGQPATEILKRSDAIAPGNPLVLAALAKAQLAGGGEDASLGTLERLAGVLRRSSAPETRDALRQARECALELHSRRPDAQRPALTAAQFSLLLGEYEAGLKVLEPYSRNGRGNADVFGSLATLYARLDRNTEALAAGKRALQIAPSRQDLVLTLAGVYQKNRDNTSAIQLLERAVAGGNGTAELYFALALSQFNFGRLPEAIANCDRALERNAQFDRALLLKGRAYARQSNPAEAARWLRKALAVNPACDYCRYELAVTLAAGPETGEAQALLRQVLRSNPRNANAHYQLGKLLAARGDSAGAIAELEAAVAADPNHDNAYYQLARLYAKQGEHAKAARALAAVKNIKAQRRDRAEAQLQNTHPD